MPRQHSSLAKLAEPSVLEKLKLFLKYYGALGYAERSNGIIPPTEFEKMQLVPLVFGLLPRQAYSRVRDDEPIKPAIRNHLAQLSVTADDDLVSILKQVCDQLYETRRDASGRTISGKRKHTIADLRSNRALYRTVIQQQNNRCALCGVTFDATTEPTLDHVVPYRLIGDIQDGANYQLLCGTCNSAKGSFLSALQSQQALNWAYGAKEAPVDSPAGEARYVALSLYRSCVIESCTASALNEHLIVRKRVPTGLAIVSNLEVVCRPHLTGIGSPAIRADAA